jgi:hypothetical protein
MHEKALFSPFYWHFIGTGLALLSPLETAIKTAALFPSVPMSANRKIF